jgi:8-oxo-dGTP diphosphatase
MKQHYNVVAAVIYLDDKILCMQRCRSRFAYTSEKWEFPGGKIEPNETEPQALKRELKEEMDYDIQIGPHLVTVLHEYPDFTISLSAYRCTPLSSDFKMYEHLHARWLSLHELRQLDWTAADVKIIDYLQQTT